MAELKDPKGPTAPPCTCVGAMDDETRIRFDERRRIAREIHDELGPVLATIRLTVGEIEMLDDHESCPAIVERLDAALAAAIDDVRRLTFELRRPPGDAETNCGRDHEVATAVVDVFDELREMVAWVTASGGIPCELRGDEGPWAMPVDRAHAICRSVRELLLNTVRHSRARDSSVTFEGGQDRLLIVVEDDGIGLKSPRSALGSGLAIVAERIRGIGGAVWSDPRHGGCRFFLLVPDGQVVPNGHVASASSETV